MSDRQQPSTEELAAAFPGLTRIGFRAWGRGAEWALGTTSRAGSRVIRAAISGESPVTLIGDLGNEVRGIARNLLGIVDSENRMGAAMSPFADAAARAGASARPNNEKPKSAGLSLRDKGEELLRHSADVRFEEDAHPAYDRILGELAPDEARILRLLALEGPQPAVDVRGGSVPIINSELIAPGLSMIGAQAGTRHMLRVPAYLNNLYRLGLIWFSREQLSNPLRYQVLEAQPDVLEAMRSGGRGKKTVRRSILLTPFGTDFCETCLPLNTGEIDALPGGTEIAGLEN